MQITENNYYSPRANKEYFSVSQFKDFQKCERCAMAKIKGEYTPEKGRALILGSLVDESLTGNVEEFLAENATELFKKNGEPYADVAQALETVELIKQQPLMVKYLSGEHQRIMTGEISGVPFKIKMDSYQPDEFIADLKYMASLRSPNLFQPMIQYWGYDIQRAVYQEIVRQNTGKKLPFYFVVATKEKPSHLAVGHIDDLDLEERLNMVKRNIQHYADVKAGKVEPERCEDYNCDYCTQTRILTEPINTDLFGLNLRKEDI